MRKENTDQSADGTDKKRKRDDDVVEESTKKLKETDQIDLKKKPLSQNTNSKLANFAFQKDDD